MNKRRLLKLADLLEADAKNKNGIKFNLKTWGDVRNEASPLSCGTTACALGLAALSGKFRRAGLGYHIAHGGLQITSMGSSGEIGAAMEVFDLYFREALWLFLPFAYGRLPKTKAAGERIVAKRIRDFVAAKLSHSDIGHRT